VQLAGGSEGTWAEPGAALALYVVPPLWSTAGFRTMFVAALLFGLWLLHRLRLRQLLATERLRLRISRDLHDEIGAGLSSIALLSDAVTANGAIDAPQRKQLARIGQSARAMVGDLRDIVWAIDPDGDRLHDVVARMRDVTDDLLSAVRVHFHAPAASELNARIDMAARRDLLLLYKEILHNVARHANASSVDITLTASGDVVELVILDDGKGFDTDTVRFGTGLRSLHARAAQLGGEFELTSRPNGGTTVRVTVRMT
jgi:signal transduction histidine kinase